MLEIIIKFLLSVNGESNHFRMYQYLKVFHDANGDGQIDENDDNESRGSKNCYSDGHCIEIKVLDSLGKF